MSLALDPEVAQALAPMAAPIADQTPPPVGDALTRRTIQDHIMARASDALPMSDDVTTTDYHATAPDGAQIPMRWYAKKGSAPGSAVLYTHGGGMILGSMDLDDRPLAGYVSASGTPMLSVDYRLAPEHRYPIQVQDAYAGLRWLDEHAKELGVDRERIAVMGESAGGGLAAAVAIMSRDHAGPAIARQIFIYPMLDDRTTTIDAHIAQRALWKYDDNVTGWGALLGDAAGGPDVPPTAAPARITDPAELPPAYIEVGQLDIFRDEDLTYALRLGRAGVEVEFHLRPGAPHMFEKLAPASDLAGRAIADRVRVLASL
jgi:acetyl esterase/lipase